MPLAPWLDPLFEFVYFLLRKWKMLTLLCISETEDNAHSCHNQEICISSFGVGTFVSDSTPRGSSWYPSAPSIWCNSVSRALSSDCFKDSVWTEFSEVPCLTQKSCWFLSFHCSKAASLHLQVYSDASLQWLCPTALNHSFECKQRGLKM